MHVEIMLYLNPVQYYYIIPDSVQFLVIDIRSEK